MSSPLIQPDDDPPEPESDLKSSATGDDPVSVGELFQSAEDLARQATHAAKRLFDRGRHRKLRISRRGEAVLPDIPLGVVAAAEAASLLGAGLLRVAAVNVGAKLLFDIEVVNDADRYYKVGVERFLEGDLERAEPLFLKAARIDDTHAEAYLQLGVLYRMRGQKEEARQVLKRALLLDETGETGRKAGEILRSLES